MTLPAGLKTVAFVYTKAYSPLRRRARWICVGCPQSLRTWAAVAPIPTASSVVGVMPAADPCTADSATDELSPIEIATAAGGATADVFYKGIQSLFHTKTRLRCPPQRGNG